MRSPARHVIAVGAGKGGVGKSTVALNIALALRKHGATGLIDFDFYGPNIAAMIGIEHRAWTHGLTLARAGPPRPRSTPANWRGLAIASAGFILGEDQPLGITDSTLGLLADQLLGDVDWPELDYLVVDLPPGTSSVQHLLVRKVPVSGALIVVTPQLVAHQDARKAVRMFRHLQVPILGAIENFAAFRCPHCGRPSELFPASPPERTIWAMGVKRLAQIAFDPRIASDQIQVDPTAGEVALSDAALAIAEQIEPDGSTGHDPNPR